MTFSINKIIIVMGITLVMLLGVLNGIETYGEDNITIQRVSGAWWTYDADDIPWAIQFNEDGTFSTAHSWIRLMRVPLDEGRFQLEGTSLTLISNKDCEGPCKGLKGHYKVEFNQYDNLLSKVQQDPCSQRKAYCDRPWVKISK